MADSIYAQVTVLPSKMWDEGNGTNIYHDDTPTGLPTEYFCRDIPDSEKIDKGTTDPSFDLASWIGNRKYDVRAPNWLPWEEGGCPVK